MALYYGRTGIIGAVMLGLGRALGETMAVTMVIGNNPQVSASLYAPQYTMAAVIANEFTEAASELYVDALVEIGLVLFLITIVINILSQALIWSIGDRAPRSGARQRPSRRWPHSDGDAEPARSETTRPLPSGGDRLRRGGGRRPGAPRVRPLLRPPQRVAGPDVDVLHPHACAGGGEGRRDGQRHRGNVPSARYRRSSRGSRRDHLRRLPVRVSEEPALPGLPLRRRHPQRRSVHRHRHLRLRDRRQAIPALLGSCRRESPWRS